ncbi:hypothetical protein P3S68_028489 [Capsicum galapagoense]
MYDRKPSLYSYCKMYGHDAQVYKKKKSPIVIQQQAEDLKKLHLNKQAIIKAVGQQNGEEKSIQGDSAGNMGSRTMTHPEDEMHLQQKIMVTWLKLCDDNIRYFYSVIKHKRSQQATTQISDDMNIWQYDAGKIAQVLVDYYKNFLEKKNHVQEVIKNGSTLVVDQQLALLQPLETEDIKRTIFSIYNTKSPSPDRFSSGFYKSSWKIISDDISAIFHEFFHNGKIPS